MAFSSSQKGQVLVLGSLLMAVLALVTVRYLQTDHVLAGKVRQTHALDAAAYSGALVQARTLNTLAFINRAHVAHQVAMAHLVTLASWAMLGGTKANQLAQGNPPAHLIGMLFGPDHGSAYLMARKATGFAAYASTGGELAQAFAQHDNTIRQSLMQAQNHLVQTLEHEREHVIRHVLHRNYPKVEPLAFNVKVSAAPFEQRLVLQSGQGDLRALVQQAAHLYRFLDRRDHTERNHWAVDPRCPHLRHQLRRRGHTFLGPDGRWQSIDTESFHALRSNRWVGCYYREYPMGWGWIPGAHSQSFQQEHVADPPDSFSAQDFWRWVQESTDWNLLDDSDNRLANSRAVATRQVWFGGGLPAIFQLINEARQQPFHIGLTLHHPLASGQTITTHSAAESFFERPVRRTDTLDEQASLFRPYWQARLAASRPVQFWQRSP